MAMSWWQAKRLFDSRRNDGRDYKRYSHNQQIEYDEQENCYLHRHHSTVTVRIYPDKYQLNTGGWDTVTTWKKINDIADPPWLWKARHSLSGADETRFLGREGRVSPYYDGIEFTGNYVHNPIPYHKRVLRNGSAKEFTKLRKAVMDRLGRENFLPRVMIGEFDVNLPADPDPYRRYRYGDAPSGRDVLEVMQAMVDESDREQFAQYVQMLLVPRPKMVFGRECSYWGNGEPPMRNALHRLQSSFAAALRAFHEENDHYELVEVKGYD